MRLLALLFWLIATSALADDAVPDAVVPPEAVADVVDDAPTLEDSGMPSSDLWEPRSRVVYSSFLALRVNPLGLVERVRFGYRHRVHPKNQGVLFNKAWVDVGMEVTLAPTYLAGGPRLEVRPLSFLGFSVTYEMIGYFGIIDAVMPLASTRSDYWEETLFARGDNGENVPALGSRLTLGAMIGILKNGFLMRAEFRALRVELNLPNDAPLMYDATQDLALPNGGWAVLGDVDIGGLIKGVGFGARYSYADSLLGDAPGAANVPNHRVGPMLAYTFHTRKAGARFNRPTILALVQWYAQHPYRSGQKQSAAIPYFALAFQFDGDLWVSKK